MHSYKNNWNRCKLREYTFSQLVTRWKRSRSVTFETHLFLSDLIELGLPGLRVVSFTSNGCCNYYNFTQMDTILMFDNLESFCLSLKEDCCWPIHFQKWVLMKFLLQAREFVYEKNKVAFYKEFYDAETNRNKLICQDFEKYYPKEKYPRFYAHILFCTILPSDDIYIKLLTNKRDLQTLEICLKYSKLALQDLHCEHDASISMLNKALDKVYFCDSNRIFSYVLCFHVYIQALYKFEETEKAARLWLEWIKDISTYQHDFDIGISINLNSNSNRHGNINNRNQNNFIYRIKLICQRWTLSEKMIDIVLEMIEFILWYDSKIKDSTIVQHILNKICVSLIKHGKYFNKLKHQLMSMPSDQVLDIFIDDIDKDQHVTNIDSLTVKREKDTYCSLIGQCQQGIKMIKTRCFRLMIHNYILRSCTCNCRYKYNLNFSRRNINMINLKYLNKAKLCLKNPFVNPLHIFKHSMGPITVFSMYWILGDEQKCDQIKQMIFSEIQNNDKRHIMDLEAINYFEDEYSAIINGGQLQRGYNLKFRKKKISIQRQIMIKHDMVQRLLHATQELSHCKKFENKYRLSGLILHNDTIKLLNNLSMAKQCYWYKCKMKSEKLLKCKQCKNVRYCSRICQKKDWVWGHRLTCTR